MLIEFSISNFRSFREKQSFSMVAAPRLHKKENVFKPEVKGEKLPDLLKVAAIYGPNASGKSNLIKAFDIVRQVAERQPSATFAPFPVAPFRFDAALANEPTQIEIHFICAEQRYQFDLALTQERIIEERLIAFPNGKETLLYERQHTDSGDKYNFGEKLEGGKDLHELWRKVTGAQVLFISQAVANSSEELNQLRTPFSWLKSGLIAFSDSMRKFSVATRHIALQFPAYAKELAGFLQEIDVPISSIRFEQQDKELLDMSQWEEDKPKTRTVLFHKTELSEVAFDFEEESEGTKSLIGFFSLWYTLSNSHIKKQYEAYIVDELDSSLHPEIIVSLVKKYIEMSEPTQFIFTTHDTHLMDAKILRRDQFWLTERDANGATQLRSIHDFAGREGEDIEKRYYEGRYRGLPIIRRG